MNAVLEIKNGWNYSSPVVAKSAAGIGTPLFTKAHNRAHAVFLRAKHSHIRIMVRRAGQPSGWPASLVTGSSNPVRLTTIEIGTSGGELTEITKEVVIMTAILTHFLPKVTIENGSAVTTSIAVADFFQKRHDDVLKKLRTLECSPAFRVRNFAETSYTRENPNGGPGIATPMYEMTKDGFVFLVMGFTGKKAAAFKEAYISEFNRLEAELAKPLPVTPAMPIFPIENDFSYLTTVEDGRVVGIQIAQPGQIFLSYDDFVRLAKRNGCIVIPQEHLRSLSSDEIIEICEAVKIVESRHK